jgi:hypothetical protein
LTLQILLTQKALFCLTRRPISHPSTDRGLVSEDGKQAVLASIRSGIRNGKTRPRAVPEAEGNDQDREPPEDPYQNHNEHDEPKRSVILRKASSIKPARVRWLWADRLAVGSLALLAGREGFGKSILAYWLVAVITRGSCLANTSANRRPYWWPRLRTRGSTPSCLD